MEIDKNESANDRAVFEQAANFKAHYEHTATEADVERVSTGIANVRTEIANVRGDSQTGIAELQASISDLKSELAKWIVGVGIAAATLASAIASNIINPSSELNQSRQGSQILVREVKRKLFRLPGEGKQACDEIDGKIFRVSVLGNVQSVPYFRVGRR